MVIAHSVTKLPYLIDPHENVLPNLIQSDLLLPFLVIYPLQVAYLLTVVYWAKCVEMLDLDDLVKVGEDGLVLGVFQGQGALQEVAVVEAAHRDTLAVRQV